MNSLSHRNSQSVGNGRTSLDTSSPFFAFHREMDQLLDSTFGGFGFTRSPSNLPTVEVQEAEKEYLLSVDLPGVEQKDIELGFNDGMLTIKAERRPSSGALYSDRWAGAFQRAVNIGADIDESQIRASLQKGVLKVTLPKNPARLPRRIEIE